MQLIVDAEANTGIQRKMSERNEEILDGNIARNLIDNFSNDIPHNESGVFKNSSLFGKDQEKDLLENHAINDKSIGSNENLLKAGTLNSTSNSDKKKNEKPFEDSEGNSTDKSNITDKKQSNEENEKQAVLDDDRKSHENQESIDLPKVNNNDLNDETVTLFDEHCRTEDITLKYDSSLDNSYELIEADTNRDINTSSDLENILAGDISENNQVSNIEVKNKIEEDAILEDDDENDKISNLENDVENNMDEDAILEDVEEFDKMCNLENEEENKLDEDALLKDVEETDKICNLENEVKNKMDVDTILEDIGKNDKIGNLENKIQDDKIREKVAENDYISNIEIDSENKMDEDAILEKDSENDKISNIEIEPENKIDEDAKIEEVTDNDNIGNLEIEVKNNIDKNIILEKIVGNDSTDNSENDLENKMNDNVILETVAGNDNISNLENEDENKRDEDETLKENDVGKNEDGDVNNTQVNEQSVSLSDNVDSYGEKEKKCNVNDETLSKDEINITHPPADKDDHDAEMIEKSTKLSEENRKSLEIETSSSDDKIAEDEKENIVSKDVNQSREFKKSLASKLSNTLDILSDDEDDQLPDIDKVIKNINNYNQSISLADDDDVMLIEEDGGEKKGNNSQINENISEVEVKSDLEKQLPPCDIKDDVKNKTGAEEIIEKNELNLRPNNTESEVAAKPLLPLNVLKNYKKNIADMTREDLEEFCISKILESVVNRSNLGDIKAQLKIAARAVEEYKKKLMMISKQTRDLQVILKSVQEEQKKPSAYPVTPLKLTRSVGMQVLMTDKPIPKKRQQSLLPTNNSPLDKSIRNSANIKTPKSNQQIPVPRLVPAATPTTKTTSITQTIVNNAVAAKSSQSNNTLVNGLRNSPPVQKPEKRTRMQSYNTVDLTDDEPPSKIAPKCSPTPPVRLVPPQNLLAPQRPPFATNINSPRKVYIPISSPQTQNIRPGQAYLLKSVPPNPGPRPKGPTNNVPKMASNSIRMNRPQHYRHPAPLPDAMKQYQPPNWKALPPAPDLKLSKVDNGIVISWKIDGYQDDSYEEIGSYQIFAYQETSSPPSTALWKKIGDVKALPLPMACTLTQFMAGFKYYFAVRAVDVKSRLGPFSLPGSILLLNKMFSVNKQIMKVYRCARHYLW